MNVQNKQKLEYTEVCMHTNIRRLCLENNIKNLTKTILMSQQKENYILLTM